MTSKKEKARQSQKTIQIGFNPEKAKSLQKKVRWIVLLCGGYAVFEAARNVVKELGWQALMDWKVWGMLCAIAVMFVLLYFGLRWAISFLGTRFGGT